MSKVSGTILGGGSITYDKQVNRRFFSRDVGNVSKNRNVYRRQDKINLPLYSNVPEAADAWNLLSDSVKNDWSLAGAQCGLTGYNLFIQDKIYRILNGWSGNGTPSELYQYKIGHLIIPPGILTVLLRQVGSSLVNTPELVTINSATDLSLDSGSGEYIKIRFAYEYDPGTGPVYQINETSLSLVADMATHTFIPTPRTGITGKWYMDIESYRVKGDLWFDNFYAQESDGIFTKDPYCSNIELFFNPLILPNGCSFISIYPKGF